MDYSRNFMSLLNPSYLQDESAAAASKKRASKDSEESREEGRKHKKSRWGGNEFQKTFIPGMPTFLPANLTSEQEKAYLIQLQIEEISRKLRTEDLGIPANPEERSPSPEPIYSSDGKRLNTREYRTRRKLEEDRHNLIQNILKINPEFKPPADYKPPVTRVNDKVMIPQEEHPEINFVGLIIGPRGNTLKSLEKETGAKIIIRGKGSIKEGKVGRKDGQPLPGEDEPLHAYITAYSLEAVKKAVTRIHEIIRQGIEVPQGQNDLRRNQLRELALLNGTLRENDSIRCTNCGATDHKSWLCPDKPNITNNIICSNCGGAGHLSKDCRSKQPGLGGAITDVITTASDLAKIDEEYMSLMAELGVGPPPDRSKNNTLNRSNTNANPNNPGLFDAKQQPQAIMGTPAPPPPTMMTSVPPPNMIPSGPPPNMMPPGPPPNVMVMGPPPNMMHPPPGMAPPPWPQPNMKNINSTNMYWGQPPVNMPPNVMQPPPPPPGVSSQPPPPTLPTTPWMTPGGSQPPPPGQTSPPHSIQMMPSQILPPPGMGVMPWQQQSQQNWQTQPPLRPPLPGYHQGLHAWAPSQQPQQMEGPKAAPQQSTPAPPGIELITLPTSASQPLPLPPSKS